MKRKARGEGHISTRRSVRRTRTGMKISIAVPMRFVGVAHRARAMRSRRARGTRAALPVVELPSEDASEVDKLEFARTLAQTSHEIGFFYLAVPDVGGVRARALARAREFFALPLDEKLESDYAQSPAFRGYMRDGVENTAGKPDRREQIEFGVEGVARALDSESALYERLVGPNVWPRRPEALRADIETFLEHMDTVSRKVMSYLAIGLKLEERYFDDTFGDEPNVQLKICKYPPTTESEFGVGEHTDSGYLSLLLQDDVGGLQVKIGDGWIDAPMIPGTLVVNLGEMLQLATSGYLLATPHRVKNCSDRARYSVPYFFNPKLDFSVSAIDLDPSLVWRRPKPSVEAVRATDSHGVSANALIPCYGENAFKSLARSHPEVMKRHHSDLFVQPDGRIVRK